MRGSPFSFSNFGAGINTIDSPYNLKQGEAREALNMVSTPRGAIKKRFGAVALGSGGTGPFTEGVVGTDNFNRTENPLSNGAKWETVKEEEGRGKTNGTVWQNETISSSGFQEPASVADTLKHANENPINNGGKWETITESNGRGKTGLAEGYTANVVYPSRSGALWNVQEYTNPAVCALIEKVQGISESRYFAVWCCIQKGAQSGYRWRYTRETETNFRATLERAVNGSYVTLAKLEKVAILQGDQLGISVLNGTVSGWRKTGGVWTRIMSEYDTTYTKGYSGIEVAGEEAFYLSEFRTGVAATSTGALWNVGEQTNPAVYIEVPKPPSEVGDEVYIWACLSKTAKSGYRLSFRKHAGVESYALRIEKWENNVKTLLLESTGNIYELSGNDKLGLSLRNKELIAWRKRGANPWERLGETTDSTYTKGYCGFGSSANGITVDNFGFGEQLAASLPEEEIQSLMKVEVAGVPYLIAAIGTKLWSMNGTGEATEIASGLTASAANKWTCVQSTIGVRVAKGPVYLSNGVDKPREWTGVAKGTATTEWTSKAEGEFVATPEAKYLVVAGNRVWAAGMSGDPSAVRWSGFTAAVAPAEGGEQPDPTQWPKANVVRFDAASSEPITGLGIVGPYVLVFKKHKTWVIFNLDEGENRRLSDSIGCASYRSIVETPQGTYFLTPDQGVYVTNGSSLKEVSYNIRPSLQGLDPLAYRSADTSLLEKAAAGYLNGHYYLSFTAQDATRKTWDFDIRLGSWWLHDLASNQWVAWEPTTNILKLYACLKTKGLVKAFEPNVYVDQGVNYTGGKGYSCFWLSSWEPFWQYFMRHRFAQPNPKKRIRQFFVDGKGKIIVLVGKKFSATLEEAKGTIDAADMSKPETPLTYGTEALEYQAGRYYALGVSRVWSFGFANSTNEGLEVNSYSCNIVFRKS